MTEGKGASVVQRLMEVWEALRKIDTNGDGSVRIDRRPPPSLFMFVIPSRRQVDQEEWCAMWDSLARGQGPQEWQEKYRDVIFSLIDTSGR